ncbi:MAG: LytR/AlgR family response regulator transcription factor [Flammeovirgaceae bacterium]
MKVILVEDAYNWQERLQEVLEIEGHEVVGRYYSSEGVWEGVKKWLPDIVFIDIGLGAEPYSGIELANHLAPLNVPFVYLTGQENEQIHIQAHRLGNAQPFRFIYKLDFFRTPSKMIRNLERELQFHDPTFVVDANQVERFSNVLYILGKGKAGKIFCRNGRVYAYQGQLSQFLKRQEHIRAPFLYQVNRNCLVNIHHVKHWQKEGVRQYRMKAF